MSKKGMTGQSSYESIIPLDGGLNKPPCSKKTLKIRREKSKVHVKTRHGWISKQQLYDKLNTAQGIAERAMVTYNLQDYDDLFDLNLFNCVKS